MLCLAFDNNYESYFLVYYALLNNNNVECMRRCNALNTNNDILTYNNTVKDLITMIIISLYTCRAYDNNNDNNI